MTDLSSPLANRGPEALQCLLVGDRVAAEWQLRLLLRSEMYALADAARELADRARLWATSTWPVESARAPAERQHPEATCHRCGGPNTAWAAPSPLWNAVMRGGTINGQDEYDGIVCPTCFALLAEARGVAHLWKLSADRVDIELETVTPSGRTWDDAAWLWRERPEPPAFATGGHVTNAVPTIVAEGGCTLTRPAAFLNPRTGRAHDPNATDATQQPKGGTR